MDQGSLNQAFLKASRIGLADDVKKYLDFGANLEAVDGDGDTALCLAVSESNIEVVDLLIAAGAKTNVVGSEGFTLLHWAAYADKKASLDLTEMLIRKFHLDVNTKDASGWTPVITAITTKGLPLASLLLKLGADPNISDRQGWTPLHHAAFRQEIDIVELLLKSGANKDVKNLKGKLPRDLAQEALARARLIFEKL